MKNFVSLFCMASLLFGSPSQAYLQSIGSQSVGYVTVAQETLDAGDFLIALFSDNLRLDPANPALSLTQTTETNPMGSCLSVAQLKLHSGQPSLDRPGTLTFGCSDPQGDASVYGWIHGQWTEMPSLIGPGGNIQIEFTELTIYAVFPEEPTEKAKPLSQI